ncbi:MAG: hypothetical protein LBR41_00255 [Rickettsiales bacterium]|jgi:hypothetical protein|nr:hypothetical protein [Rickettsiales bacterium]
MKWTEKYPRAAKNIKNAAYSIGRGAKNAAGSIGRSVVAGTGYTVVVIGTITLYLKYAAPELPDIAIRDFAWTSLGMSGVVLLFDMVTSGNASKEMLTPIAQMRPKNWRALWALKNELKNTEGELEKIRISVLKLPANVSWYDKDERLHLAKDKNGEMKVYVKGNNPFPIEIFCPDDTKDFLNVGMDKLTRLEQDKGRFWTSAKTRRELRERYGLSKPRTRGAV